MPDSDPDNSTTEMPPSDPVFSPAAAASEVGCLGKYRVLRRLGRGGMGAVYLGFDPLLHRQVALKVMLPRFAAHAPSRERFFREARAVANVRSDHVVTIHDIGEEAGNPFFAMEYLRGQSLDDWLRTGGTPAVAEAVRVAREIAAGLAAAHGRGLVHRDIKPGNVWLEEPARRVKILDFGLAKASAATTPEAEITRSGQALGTPAYMSPEQARGDPVDHRTDLFSLGVVLYQLLTGRLPFPGATAFEVLTRLAVHEPAPVRELNPAVPPRLAALVHRLLAKDPAGRPASADEVIRALAATDAPPQPPGPPTPPAASTVPDLRPRPADRMPAPSRGVPMPYSAQISRVNPACVLLLIDQSKSMGKPFPGTPGQSKAEAVADAVNRLIQNLVLRSAKADGVRDYFRVGVIGYGKGIRAGLGGTLPADVLVPISQVSDHPLRVEARTKKIPDGAGGVIEQTVKFPVWFEPTADGNTPMCAALVDAALTIKVFIEQFPNAFPPIVLNLTDGEPSDGNPQENARGIRARSTSDGNVLLFNLLLSSAPLPAKHFPENESGFTDNLSKLLFRMSSELPPPLFNAAKAEGFDVQPGARGVVINADPTALVRFLDIGTRVNPVAGR